MLFKKKNKLRKTYDEIVLQTVNKLQQEWLKNKKYMEKSIDLSDELLFQFKLSEAKYFYSLREAKLRNISINKSRK